MNKERLPSFLHLIKRGSAIKLGADYLTLTNLPRINLVLVSSAISDESRKKVNTFTNAHNILTFDVPANIVISLYPGKNVKVLVITNRDSAKKIANLMKEGESYE